MSQESLITLAIAVLLLPLAGFLVTIMAGKRLPRQGDWVGTFLVTTGLLLSIVILTAKLGNYSDDTLTLRFTWVDFGDVPGIGPLKIILGLAVDNLAAVMTVVVMIISTLVHYFSIGYMHGDVRYSRYFAYLGLFTFSMLTIVLADNLFLLYCGWELVGICSYLLIGHWYEKKSASDAAMKAFIVNRVGDVGFFAGVMILFATFHTFGLQEIFASMAGGTLPYESTGWLTAAGVLLFCGAIGKSAQFPLHVWLPDAMEGPTPVSALIHAATMVAAGVYMIARLYPILTADALVVIAYIGAITAFISATIAVAQNDIKKVLAYSTISQLGYMVMGLGVGAYTAGFFHLVTHAMFKAGLFLGSGSVIHAMHHALHTQHDHHTDPQDIRNMGGLRTRMPVTFWTFLVYTFAIAGFPLTSGFLSKDAVLGGTLAFGHLTGDHLVAIVGFFVAGLTAFYMFRLVILTFLGKPADEKRLEHIHESPAVMVAPLIILAALSVFFVYSINPFSAAEGWLTTSIERPDTSVPQVVAPADAEAFEHAAHETHSMAIMLSLSVAAAGTLLAFLVYYWRRVSADAMATRFSSLYTFLLNKWYFDELYNRLVVGGTLAWTRVLNWFDTKAVDGFVNGTASWTRALVFGYADHSKEKKTEARIYMAVAVVATLLVTGASIDWFWPPDPTLSSVLLALMGIILTGGLTLFLFWAGAGGFDRHVVDGVVNATAYLSGFGGLLLRKFQTGKVQNYVIFAVMGAMALYFLFRII
jgi:NADH-quinone oxidoreductase subunit L